MLPLVPNKSETYEARPFLVKSKQSIQFDALSVKQWFPTTVTGNTSIHQVLPQKMQFFNILMLKYGEKSMQVDLQDNNTTVRTYQLGEEENGGHQHNMVLSFSLSCVTLSSFLFSVSFQVHC